MYVNARVAPPIGGGVRLVSNQQDGRRRDLRPQLSLSGQFPFPERANRDLKDRAKRAVEIGEFPHERARDREHVQEHVEHLLDFNDGMDPINGTPELARRVLVTGSPLYRSAMGKYISGHGHPTYEESRALALGTGAQGGFQIVYTLDPTIIPTSNLSVNPYRQICRQETIAGSNEWRGISSSGVTATYNAEGAEMSDNSPTLVQPSVVVQTASTFIPFSIQYGQDVGNVEAIMAGLIQDAKDDLEAVQFTSGVGTGVYPAGLLTFATTTVSTTGGGAFTVADMYKLENALGPRFRPRASIIGNRQIFNLVRAFDTAGGAGMWFGYPNPLQGGMASNVPQSGRLGVNLLAYPAYECSAYTTAITGNSLILTLGDFNYFLIVDRVGLDIEIIPNLMGPANRYPTLQRGLLAFWRNGTKVLSTAAFATLKT